MPSDYQRILEKNLHEYGHGDRHLAFIGGLYTDRTHFVYELLQNAEDAGAESVKFVLHADRLEVLHDGRVFNEKDVRGVCGVGDGTSAEDLTKIGRFGIGFKSVYAFTSTPEVHSGEEHFRICRYIRPEAVLPSDIPEPCTTLFRFPFDHKEIEPNIAFDEISQRLRDLGLRTLLFLHNIEEIQWVVAKGCCGTYRRETEQWDAAKRIRLQGDSGDSQLREEWLVFRGPVELPAGADASDKDRVRVEIAYRLSDGGGDELSVLRLDDSPLVVFFPTEKPTKLGFLVQGPYRTTPARDNVPAGDEWNKYLVRETAELLIKSLRVLRRTGDLTPELLETLPLQEQAFPKGSMFRPLFERTREAFQNEALLPAEDGNTIRASEAVIARGTGLRELLSSSQLQYLLETDAEPRWLSSKITQRQTPALRDFLVRHLGILELTAEGIARRFSESFFVEQSDEWMARFYAFLLGQESLWAKKSRGSDAPLLKQPFIRLSSDEHVLPFEPDDSPNAYLPGGCDLQVPFVKHSVASNREASMFLQRLGLCVPESVDEVIESVIRQYDGSLAVPVRDEEYMADLQAIATAIRTDSRSKRQQVLDQARKASFLLAVNASSGESKLKSPGEIYIRSDHLADYFAENPNAWFLADRVATAPFERNELEELKIAEHPRVIPFDPGLDSKEKGKLRKWGRETTEVELVDYEIDGLAEILARVGASANDTNASGIACLIWNVMLGLLKRHEGDGFWYGKYVWMDYDKRWDVQFESRFLSRLKNCAWLPNKDSELCKPSDIELSQLPDEFDRNDELTRHLGIQTTSKAEREAKRKKRQAAQELGLDLEVVEFLRNDKDAMARLRNELNASKSKPDFPERAPADPTRREEKVIEELETAPGKAYEPHGRSVRVSSPDNDPKTWLRNQYTNDADQMICQICGDVMPFKKLDGKHYFEAIELTDTIGREHRALFIALCPVCAAKYKEFVKKDYRELAQVEAQIRDRDSPLVALNLGDKSATLRFVDTHWLDLRTVLRHGGKSRGHD